MAKLNAVIVDPDGMVRKTKIEDTLGGFQAVVGGYLEAVYGADCTVYVNEEGLILSLPYNQTATEFAAEFCDLGSPLHGTALIVGPCTDEGNDTGVRRSVVNHFNLED